MNIFLKPGWIVSLLLSISLPVKAAGGIALGATRVIYPAEDKQTSLSISNSDGKSRFLVNSWVENSRGEKEKTFVVTPPLFVSEPESENTLRIIYAGQPLPDDRESLFWLSVKAIPSVNKENATDKNVLQLAVLSRIKLFVRPKSLTGLTEDAPAKLQFSRLDKHLNITNPSAYYITLVNVHMGNQKLDNVMVAPKSRAQVLIPPDVQGGVTFQTVNDYGALTPVKTVGLP
ncbi:type 1 fimbria chaperone FimC [Kosakonia pseudosacchari]|uniref:Fimbrial chaperone protein FimC n=1 Tax=Kosakonia pseudosacchari TaxID=1646340 RepID=A0ABX4IPN1_9ENTR|nr:type 1 fimbria chaperone FimC [Kosakonia pseudosacchari]PDO86693.1 fimbrial chaperone protein FimC [Kosakonia pseudosacchari]WBU48294.1 type 1 fimbria chaperone FimC [Kosakonia pseudosacchari]